MAARLRKSRVIRGAKTKERLVTREIWLSDCEKSLRKLLASKGHFVEAFKGFLKVEHEDEELIFYLEAQAMTKITDEARALEAASQLYETYLAELGDGIGQQDRTRATQRLWTKERKRYALSNDDADLKKRRRLVVNEADVALRSLAFDQFPRFLRSKKFGDVHDDMVEKSTTSGSSLSTTVEAVGSMLPRTADEWLDAFVCLADTWPASIVVSDMTIAGAPMVYVNTEFSEVTGYPRDESVGRNCRFLQGPDTEPEAIEVIQRTLAAGRDCQVLLTNYRKNGDKFRNLLSMRPIFDAEGLYRFVIGVQLEVNDLDPELGSKLVRAQKLLRLVPPKLLELKSNPEAVKRGCRAPPVAAAAAAAADGGPAAEGLNRATASLEPADPSFEKASVVKDETEWADTVFALTRIAWLRRGQALVKDLLGCCCCCQGALDIVMDFARRNCHPFVAAYAAFVAEATDALRDENQLFRVHLRMHKNPFYYCTKTDIKEGEIHSQDWTRVRKEVERALEVASQFLAEHLLPRLLRSKAGPALVHFVRKLELENAISSQCNARTCAYGVALAEEPEQHWLHMFASITAEFDHIGVVVSDMRVPGIPLAHVNDEGFCRVTGFDGPAQIGKKCSSVLQGPETEDYLVEQICHALRDAQPLAIKITNYKENQQKFQCFLTLHPVFGVDGEYLYQVGTQVDMSAPRSEVYDQLVELEQLLQLLPSSILCTNESDLERQIIPSGVDDDDGGSFDAHVQRTMIDESSLPPSSRKNEGKTHTGVDLRAIGEAVWLVDAEQSLQVILDSDIGRQAFEAFLDAEDNQRPALDFYLAIERLANIPCGQRDHQAEQTMKEYNISIAWTKKSRIAKAMNGCDTTNATVIAQNNSTASTESVWRQYAASALQNYCGVTYEQAKSEARDTLRMLAVDAFPRFMRTKNAARVMDALVENARPSTTRLMTSLARKASAALPQDANEWLRAFATIAETWPACIVIADMSIAGAPMIYVNPEFCRVTEYSFEECAGRNCRFLQGPETEPESVAVIQRALSGAQSCHVLITNYRKSGAKFKNLLTMKPVFDTEGEIEFVAVRAIFGLPCAGTYRFVIGVQFEVKSDMGVSSRLSNLEKLLQLLPRELPMTSSNNDTKGREPANSEIEYGKELPVEYLPQRFAFTKLKWLLTSEKTFNAILADDLGVTALTRCIESANSPLARCALDFCKTAQELLSLAGTKQQRKAKMLHKRMINNSLYYCTTTEIPLGEIEAVDWSKVIDAIKYWSILWATILRRCYFRQLLNSTLGADLFIALRERERGGDVRALATVCCNSDAIGEDLWLNMIQEVSTVLEDIGLCVSDVRIPGVPLTFIGTSFKAVTGYGMEQLNHSCRFLQRAESEAVVVKEIREAIRAARPIFVKIRNYKKDGTAFQNLLTLNPVFTRDGAYCFQVGTQLKNGAETSEDSSVHLGRLLRLADICRLLPNRVGRLMPIMEQRAHNPKRLNSRSTHDAFSDQDTSSSSMRPHGASSPLFVHAATAPATTPVAHEVPQHKGTAAPSDFMSNMSRPLLPESTASTRITTGDRSNKPVATHIMPRVSHDEPLSSESRGCKTFTPNTCATNHAHRRSMCRTMSTLTESEGDPHFADIRATTRESQTVGQDGNAGEPSFEPRPPGPGCSQRPTTAHPRRSGSSLGDSLVCKRPKSALLPRSQLMTAKSSCAVDEDQRIAKLMAKHGGEEMKRVLISGKSAVVKMTRAIGSMLEDELNCFRSVFEGGGSVAGMSRSGGSQVGDAVAIRGGTMDLKTLKNERALFQRLGFVEHVCQLDERIDCIAKRRRGDLAQKIRETMDRRLRYLKAQQRRRMQALKLELDQQLESTRRQHAINVEKLAETHHQQRKDFLSRTLRVATGDEVDSTRCGCTNPFACKHNRTASYRLRKTNPMVVKYRAAAKRLQDSRRIADAMEYSAKADEIDNIERLEWTRHVEMSATTAQLPRLIEAQERASQSLQTKHDAIIKTMQQRRDERLAGLQKVLHCELEKVTRRMKQQVVDAENGRAVTIATKEATPPSMSSVVSGRSPPNTCVTMSDNIVRELGWIGANIDELFSESLFVDSPNLRNSVRGETFDGLPNVRNSLGEETFADPPPNVRRRRHSAGDDGLREVVLRRDLPTKEPEEARRDIAKYRPWEQPEVKGLDNSKPILLV